MDIFVDISFMPFYLDVAIVYDTKVPHTKVSNTKIGAQSSLDRSG